MSGRGRNGSTKKPRKKSRDIERISKIRRLARRGGLLRIEGIIYDDEGWNYPSPEKIDSPDTPEHGVYYRNCDPWEDDYVPPLGDDDYGPWDDYDVGFEQDGCWCRARA